ncbi:S9 family peptidase [Shewanella sp. NIFS-20-20]|uniref:alpha/beta hydrolase family protein n=1 Tax=Shewanella sp. NIFS-20-20 TaxID=2853806 RepID=UPI001C473549|nr:prolyl oligopeptidase family serine peptidase [Shewanella sp. NIFS-20-20]MBV7314264.1 prolyl oligopeptidase family serine peptidase [Shewanella sp. NIFS-20-20]
MHSRLILTLLLLWSMSDTLFANEYQASSPLLEQVLATQAFPSTKVSRDGKLMLLATPISTPDIAQLSQPKRYLAGLELHAHQSRAANISGQYQAIELIDLTNGQLLNTSALADYFPLTAIKFSPDSRHLSAITLATNQPQLLTLTLTARASVNLSPRPVNGILGFDYQWLANSQGIIYRGQTDQQAISPPYAPSQALIIRETQGRPGQRTYANLLKNANDADRFAALTHAQISEWSIENRLNDIGPIGHYASQVLSPDNRYLLVNELSLPFSYKVRYSGFSRAISVFDRHTQQLQPLTQIASKEHQARGKNATSAGPRHHHWHPAQAATLVWYQALDKGVSQSKLALRDSIMTAAYPNGESKQRLATPGRISHTRYGDDGSIIVYQQDRYQQQQTVSVLAPTGKFSTWYQRSLRDKYSDPGRLHQRLLDGQHLVAIEDGHVVHSSLGYFEQGQRPALKRTRLSDNHSEILWQSAPDRLEYVIKVINLEPLQLLIRTESATQPPALKLVSGTHTGKTLYQAPANAHSLAGVTKQPLQFRREDGLMLSGELYLPTGYDVSQGPLPLLMWAYPREFQDEKVAQQTTYSPNKYLRISPRSPIYLAGQGIAVLDKLSMPIVASQTGKANDNFRAQIIANAQAAVDTVVEMGITAPGKIAVGGHSYGAFMVGNLLAHTDLFSAGIARSGAYNRSLTPFGFQSEGRDYWQATDLYLQMSPFTYAHQIKEPLLLIHGLADPNSGTYPMQSQRMFDALDGLGGKAKLVMLPYEGHSYKAKQSLAQLWWEQSQWLQQHLAD